MNNSRLLLTYIILFAMSSFFAVNLLRSYIKMLKSRDGSFLMYMKAHPNLYAYKKIITPILITALTVLSMFSAYDCVLILIKMATQ